MTELTDIRIGGVPLFIDRGYWVFQAGGAKAFRAPALFGGNSPAAFEFTVGLAREYRVYQNTLGGILGLGGPGSFGAPLGTSSLTLQSNRKALVFKAAVSYDTDTGTAIEGGVTFGALEQMAQGALAAEAVSNRPLRIGPLTIPRWVGAGVSVGEATGVYLVFDRPSDNSAVGQGAIESEYTVVVPYEGDLPDALVALRSRMLEEPQEVWKEVLETGVITLDNGEERSVTDVLSDIEEAEANGDLPEPGKVECFSHDALVSLADGGQKAIGELRLGDQVVSFGDRCDLLESTFSTGRVTAIHTREAEETLDFHGTIVTPGHVFLSGDGTFKKLAEILEEDGTVVREDGSLMRARTGCPVGSVEDLVVPVTYTDTETGETMTAAMRAGAPFAAEGEDVVTVADAMRKVGYELGADGFFTDIDGNRMAAHWPWGEPDPRALAENRAAFV